MNTELKSKSDFPLGLILGVIGFLGVMCVWAIPGCGEAAVRKKIVQDRASLRLLAIALGDYEVDRMSYPPSLEFLTIVHENGSADRYPGRK